MKPIWYTLGAAIGGVIAAAVYLAAWTSVDRVQGDAAQGLVFYVPVAFLVGVMVAVAVVFAVDRRRHA